MGMVDERTRYYTVVKISGKWHRVASLGQGNDDGDNDNCDEDDCREGYDPVTASLVFHSF